MSVRYDGYNTNCLTMEKGDAVVGSPASVNTSGKATLAVNGKPFIGLCVSIRGDYAVIQTHGYMKLPYVQEPDYGVCALAAGTGGTVSPATLETAGRPAIVVEVDTVNKTVGFII